MTCAAESAKIGYPEVTNGIVAAIVMPNLVRQVGRKAAPCGAAVLVCLLT